MTDRKPDTDPPPNPNMELWNRLCRTDPAKTKKVKKSATSREFTAIDAHSQVMAATEQWGPCGGAWGFSWEWIPDPDLWLATVTLRYPAKMDALGHVGNAMEYKVSQIGSAKRKNKWGTDDDAPKKAITDGLTKCFSYTGMNADVFMGKFDDNKYVAALREEFANPNGSGVTTGKEDLPRFVPHSNVRAIGKDKIKKLSAALCGDKDWFEYFQGLAADLGMPMDADAMNDEQVEHIIAEMEAMKAARADMAGEGQGELDGVPMSAYEDEH
jgi:hypothetical protein